MHVRSNLALHDSRLACLGSLPFLAVLLMVAAPSHAQWTLDDAVMPEGVSLSVEHRSRYEFLDDQFRTTSNKDSDVIASRTLIHGRVDLPRGLTIGAELADSRAEQNSDTLLDSTIVNSVELLQSYVELDREDVAGGRLNARAGRITMDVGSRRFVARNRYRNTINGFTGIDVDWMQAKSGGGLDLRAFWTLPVDREPNPQVAQNRRRRLLDNDIVFDTESIDVQFWGAFAARDFGGSAAALGRGEFFVFGLHESDASNRPTRNRQLVTPGFRLFRAPATAHFDYVVESAIQVGQSRSSTSSRDELDHLAHFHHLTIGYTFDVAGSPRVAFQYDFASGDGNPNDGKNGRFDTLFGARRFDFGPTGIYGAFARANLHSPGVRVEVKPHAQLSSFVAVRTFWLASKQDAWTTSGVQDAAGDSGDHVATQIELSVRWDVVPGNVRIESGYAHLFAGEFIDDAPNSNRQGDSNYVYSQIALSF